MAIVRLTNTDSDADGRIIAPAFVKAPNTLDSLKSYGSKWSGSIRNRPILSRTVSSISMFRGDAAQFNPLLFIPIANRSASIDILLDPEGK